MPFYRVQLNGEKETVRTITGALPPPEPGVAQSEDGIIVGSVADPSGIKAGTEVKVRLPGPRERLFDANGILAPAWYRFFSELYRRTGGVQDNINFVPSFRKLPLEPFALTLTGAAPSVQIFHGRMVGAGSMAITGIAPTVA